jgi:hypothetical protein
VTSQPVNDELTSHGGSSAQGRGRATLRDVLVELLPGEFPGCSRGGEGGPSSSTEGIPVLEGEQGEGDTQGAEASPALPLPPHMRVTIAGIEPPLGLPLSWLHTSLKSPDHFLYIVVHLDVL